MKRRTRPDRFFNRIFQNREEVERFIENLSYDLQGCKNWPHPHQRKIITVAGKGIRVSRLVLEAKLGRDIKQGYGALHSCGNGRCVNSEHIYEGTPKDNARDTIRHGRSSKGMSKMKIKKRQNHWLEIWNRLKQDRNTRRF